MSKSAPQATDRNVRPTMSRPHPVYSLFFIFMVMAQCAVAADDSLPPKNSFLFVATYSPRAGEGIFVSPIDTRTGEIGRLRATGNLQTVAAFILHPRKSCLYATTLILDPNGQPTGAIAAFTIDTGTGELKEIDRRASGGTGACYLSVDTEGRCLAIANCGTATVACLKLQPDGKFGETSSLIQHTGTSRNSEGKPQAHSILIAPRNKFAIAADLGLDRIFIYKLDPDESRLVPHDPASLLLSPETGPRHLAFHPSGQFAYSVNELSNTISAIRFGLETGSLQTVETVSTLPGDFHGESYAAEIQVHPSGKFLYASNRGHDSVAAYSISQQTGRLASIGHTLTGGKFPRHFTIDPTGRVLIVANQKSDSVGVFQIDLKSGQLHDRNRPASIPQPVCVRILNR